MMRIHIEIDEAQVEALITQYIEDKLVGSFDKKNLTIEVKSKQNYKSEWERASFRAVYHEVLP